MSHNLMKHRSAFTQAQRHTHVRVYVCSPESNEMTDRKQKLVCLQFFLFLKEGDLTVRIVEILSFLLSFLMQKRGLIWRVLKNYLEFETFWTSAFVFNGISEIDFSHFIKEILQTNSDWQRSTWCVSSPRLNWIICLFFKVVQKSCFYLVLTRKSKNVVHTFRYLRL